MRRDVGNVGTRVLTSQQRCRNQGPQKRDGMYKPLIFISEIDLRWSTTFRQLFFKQQFSQQNVHEMLAIVHSYVMLTPSNTISLFKMCHVTHSHGNCSHIEFDKFSTCGPGKFVT